ncbi:MAG: phosphate ABC transporter ATP-binding protein PstB [Candidatus Bathyarchaeota archaeon]|nr:phosphate ABC transporter ATP-binding protein PstB [Candidatus Bathyarchaeota archaeon]
MGKVQTKKFNLWFKNNHILKNVDFEIREKTVTAIMGPSGCGKSTLLRSINRMNDLINGCKTAGEIFFDGMNIYSDDSNVYDLRRRIGMVFQKPNPFPKSIFENVAFGPRIHNTAKGEKLKEVVENSLRGAALWDEVKDRLNEHAFSLSGGQQQRLCIARALAAEPELILMDEPCSALDPAATARIETLVGKLKEKYTVIIVTHNLQQALRVSDFTAFMYVGQLVEYNNTRTLFERPANELTRNYINGKFG